MPDERRDSPPPPVDPRWRETVGPQTDPSASIHVRAPVPPPAPPAPAILAPQSAQNGSGSTAQLPAVLPGEAVSSSDRFDLRRVLGHGGMGTVYHAAQHSLARDVALKVLKAGGAHDPALADAFLREAKTTGALSHPHIVPVHLFGCSEDGRLFIVMKRVRGRPWSELLTPLPGSFDLRAHLDIFLKVCDAVAFAHAHGIVHRDLKPANVMIGDFGEVMVMDWGLAVDVAACGDRGMALPREQASALAGTPAYMAPEMVRGELGVIGTHTDIYLLGGILYEILTGRPPHADSDVRRLLIRIASGQLDPPVPRAGLGADAHELESVLLRALAPDPAQRCPSAAALQADIRAFLAGQSHMRESEALAECAQRDLAALKKETEDMRVTSPYYPRCAEILNQIRRAAMLWSAHPRLPQIRLEALALFAELAVREKDWGLAEVMIRDLKLSGAEGQILAEPIERRMRALREGARLQDYSAQRLFRLAILAAILAAAASVWFYWRASDAENARPARRLQQNPAAGHSAVRERQIAPPASLSHLQALGALTLPVARADDRSGLQISAKGACFCFSAEGQVFEWQAGETAGVKPAAGWPEGERLTAAAWNGAETLLAGMASGKIYQRAPNAMQWQELLRLERPVMGLAAGAAGQAAVSENELALFTASGLSHRDFLTDAPLGIQFLPDGTVVLACRNSLRIWWPQGHDSTLPLAENFSAAALAKNAPEAALLPSERPGEVQILHLDLSAGQIERSVLAAGWLESIPSALAFSADGKGLAIGLENGNTLWLSGAPLQIQAQTGPRAYAVRALAVDAAGARLLGLDSSGTVSAWALPR